MVFPKKCGSEKLHGGWQCTQDARLLPTSKVSVAVKNKLLELAGKTEKSHHSRQAVKFCEDCVGKVIELYPELRGSCQAVPSDQQASDEQSQSASGYSDTDAPEVKKRRIDESQYVAQLSTLERCNLAYELGKSVNASNYAKQSSQDRELQSLLHVNASTIHVKENGLLISFVKGYTGQESELAEHVTYRLCKTVESVLDLTSANLVLPVHFRESVLIYTLTGSKIALQVLGGGGAHASYQSVKAWLTNLGTIEKEDSGGDVIIGFDNNQVLQRRWKVKLRNDVKCNIVTVIVKFVVSENGTLQEDAKLKPGEWAKRDLTPAELDHVKFIDKSPHVKETHYNFLYPFLEKELQSVINEQEKKETIISDAIDAAVEKQKHDALYKTCYNCSFTDIPKAKHLCPRCKFSVTKSKMKAMGIDECGNVIPEKLPMKSQSSTEYRVTVVKSTGQRHAHKLSYKKTENADDYMQCTWYEQYKRDPSIQHKPIVQVQEPAYVNPCSYEAVATVMRNIGNKSGAIRKYRETGIREWVVVVCDGLPYNLCNRVIQSMYVCSACKTTLNGKNECREHQEEIHKDVPIDFPLEFDWVLLQPGMGHIEMNMVKGIVELAWDVFWKQMVICFNFRSETALKYAKKVSDHHKGWTLCRIARKALTQELMIPFVRHELRKSNPDLAITNFFKFTMTAQDPNYTFICDFTFEILDSVFLYRAGVRCDIPLFIEAGRAKFAKVWSGRNHPLYRELEMADSLHLARMPPEVRDFVLNTASLNLSGRMNTGEGADFRLEEVNRIVQQWLPNIPSTKDWQTACCNFDKLVELRQQLFEQMEIDDPKLGGKQSRQNIDEEVMAFRTKLRASEYLLNPTQTRDHISIDGSLLDPDLKDFCKNARERRAKYMDCYLSHEKTAAAEKAKPPRFSFFPVYVTPAEKERYTGTENMTVAQIKEHIQERINAITDSDVKDVLESMLDEMKRSNKGVLLEFLNEVNNYHNAENDPVFEDEESDSSDEEQS